MGGIEAQKKLPTSKQTAQEKKYLDMLSGKFDPEKNAAFVRVPEKYSIYNGVFMRKDAFEAFEQMALAAKKDGFAMYILSGTRNFYAQKSIWENKFNGRQLVNGKKLNEHLKDHYLRALEILRYSSMPGTSRHHWGTDFDIAFKKTAAGMLENHTYEKGEGAKFYQWLLNNAALYGFCQPYKGEPQTRRKNYQYGYQEEKWHWSYFKVSAKLTRDFLAHKEKLAPAGFAGAEAGRRIFHEFVGNVDLSCQ